LQQNKTAPVVACRIYVRAGSLTEGKYMGCGISHVLEHLVAGASSAKRKESESAEILKSIGNDSNAFTTLDNTCYFITTTSEKYPVAVDVLADWVTNCQFTDAEFAREYKVVQREIEMGEAEAERTFSKLTYSTRYLVHPARHPVIGYKPAFQKLTAADARAYYKMMYVPDNLVVSLAGDMDLDAAQKLVVEKMGSVRRTRVPAISLPAEPPVLSPRTAVARADVRQARLQIGFPTVDLFSKEMYPLDVLAGVLAQGESSILVRDLRDERRLVSGITAYDETPAWGDGTLAIAMELAPDKIPAARRAIIATLKDIAEKGIDPKEIEKVKARTSAELIYGNQTAEQQATRGAEDFLSTGDVDFAMTYAARIKKVTPEQVNEAARKYIRMDAMLTAALLPLGAPDNVSASGATQAVAAAKLPVEKRVLSNGLTVLLCRNSAAPLVAMQLYVTGGLLAEDDKNNGTGSVMMELMTRGAGKRSANDVSEFLDMTGGSLGGVSGNNTFSLSAVCLKENFNKTFELFTDTVTAPTFSDDELEKIRPLLLAGIEGQTEDWFDEAYKFTREQFFVKSPYHNMATGRAGVVSKLSAKDIRTHYEKFFQNPKGTVLAIYGDLDQMPDLEKSAFSKIPAGGGTLNLVTELASGKTVIQPTEKQSATVMLAYGPGSVAGQKDRDAMLVLQTLLGGYNSPGGPLLHETLRGKGLVYTVQATNIPGVKHGDKEARGTFLIAALGEPGNADQIVTIIEQIVADVKAGKTSEKDIAGAKDQAITGHQLQNQTIASQAQDQALDELMGLGYNDNDTFAARIKAVTKDDVVRAANAYLQSPVIAITKPKK
jgi:zinc protease